MSGTVSEEAYIKKEIEDREEGYILIKKIEEVEIYLQAKATKTFPEDTIKEYGNILEEELLPPFVNAIKYFHLKPMPQYLVVAWAIPKDIVLFANAYNDGIKIFFNHRNTAFKWLWISDTTIFHEVGHIWESREIAKPIMYREQPDVPIEKLWSLMNSDLYVNSNLPESLHDSISSLVCLSMLSPALQYRLLEESAATRMMRWVDIKISTLEFMMRFYTIPRKYDLINQFLKACVDMKLPETNLLEDIIMSKNFESMKLFTKAGKSIAVQITCLYDPLEKRHTLTIEPHPKR